MHPIHIAQNWRKKQLFRHDRKPPGEFIRCDQKIVLKAGPWVMIEGKQRVVPAVFTVQFCFGSEVGFAELTCRSGIGFKIKSMKKIVCLIVFCFCVSLLSAQVELADLFTDSTMNNQNVTATFKSTRVINARSVETLHLNDLVFLVLHRFGDVGGDAGGSETFWGLDNSTDILIGFEYGLTDLWTVGIGRAKGAPNGVNTSQRQLVYLESKYRLLTQRYDESIPVSVAFFANSVVSAMKKLEFQTSDASFGKFSNRLSFVAQVIVARKFSSGFSMQVLPTYVHRNYVTAHDQSGLFALGVAARAKFSKRMALIVDYFYVFRSSDSKTYFEDELDFQFYNPLSLGIEIETGGHVFNLSFTNSTAILENQFIPSTSSSWGGGEFRWGFSISRTFSLGKSERDWKE